MFEVRMVPVEPPDPLGRIWEAITTLFWFVVTCAVAIGVGNLIF